MIKRNKIVLIIIIAIVITIAGLYGTFAIDTQVTKTAPNTYNIILTDDRNELTIPSNTNKTVIYQLHNPNEGTVKYNIGFEGNNINVKEYSDSDDSASGLIEAKEYKFIKLRVENTGNNESTAVLSTVLGYEHGGDLIVPESTTLVTEKYIESPASKYISNLYSKASKSTVINNNITYNYATSVNLMNDRLGGTTTSLDDGNIRYYGADPDNYVYFNCSNYDNPTNSTCEKWRIIGIFENKVKIIRADGLYGYSIDTSPSTIVSGYGISSWNNADLMKLLNPGYNDNTDLDSTGNSILVNNSLYYNGNSGTCYNGQSNSTKSCNFTSSGFKNDTTRNMTAEVTWYLGSPSNSSTYANTLYAAERSNNIIINPTDGITRSATWQGKVALMYISDYAYSVDFRECSSNMDRFSNDECKNNLWLLHGYWEWFLDPSTSNSIYDSNAYASFIPYGDNANLFGIGGSCFGYWIRPTTYLKSDVLITGGTGTSSDPYKLNVKNN